jgi:hypothetical protein
MGALQAQKFCQLLWHMKKQSAAEDSVISFTGVMSDVNYSCTISSSRQIYRKFGQSKRSARHVQLKSKKVITSALMLIDPTHAL